ncbi:MAG: GWxTD domain-containing protein [Ignavibacteriae bacterium]|nr:GWxTD domain-containing protein [Ignavibacteriota bacterium]
MTLHWHSFACGLALTVAALNTILAQPQQERESQGQSALLISYEAIPFYSVDSAAALVRFHYRISQRFFVFVRDQGSSKGFIAKGELMVELRNKQDIAVGREIRQIRLNRDAQPLENEQLSDLQGSVTFPVPEDEYTVIVSVDDKESGRKFINRERKVVTALPRNALLEISNPIFARVKHDGGSGSETFVIPTNRGTNVTFGVTSGLLYQVYLPESAPINVRWRIQRQGDFLSDWFQTFAGDQYSLLLGTLSPLNPQEEATYKVIDAKDPGWKLLYIPLPIEKLDPGGWNIDVECSSGEKHITRHYAFQVQWLNRPAALLNSQMSIDALKHIATEDELAGMQTGSFDRNVKAFYDFWKTKDPDTTTAYNEMMVEYYRRVDEANRRFSTYNSPDGFQTDRGRIFILYGEPTNIEKYIPPGEAPSELWVYERLKRKFVFSDKYKNGNFLLIAADTL